MTMRLRWSLIALAMSPDIMVAIEKMLDRALVKAYHTKGVGYDHLLTLNGEQIREMERGMS